MDQSESEKRSRGRLLAVNQNSFFGVTSWRQPKPTWPFSWKLGEGKEKTRFFPVQLRFIDARVTLTYKRELVPNPSGPASLPSDF